MCSIPGFVSDVILSFTCANVARQMKGNHKLKLDEWLPVWTKYCHELRSIFTAVVDAKASREIEYLSVDKGIRSLCQT